MKIIFLKSKINTLFLFLLLTHSLFGQETTGFKGKKIESTTKHRFSSENTKTDSSRLATLAPNATISGNLSICLPGPNTTQLTGSGIPNPTNPWTSSNLAVATINNTGLVTAVGFGATTITYRDNIGNQISENVYVSTFPTISSPSGTFATCAAGGNLQLEGSIFANATTPWESTNTAIATVDNTGLVTGVSGGTVNILYRNLGGCTVLQAVTINPLLSPTLSCGASTFNQVTVNWSAVAGASTYTVVYTVNGGAFQFGASGNILTWTKTGLLSGDSVEFFVTPVGPVSSCFTNANITCSTLTCTPASTPAAPIITPTQPTCSLATGSVTITGVAGLTYSFDGGAYSSTLVYSGLTAGSSHTVTAKNVVGCISAASIFTLGPIFTTPAAPVSLGDIVQCEISPNQTLTAAAIVPFGQTITWYDTAILGSPIASPTLNTFGSITYYAQANNGSCNSSTRTAVTLTINAAPAAPISIGDITQCQQLPIQTLTATAIVPALQTITWYNAPTALNIVLNPILNSLGAVTYYAEANNGTCNSITRTPVTLTIKSAPNAPVFSGITNPTCVIATGSFSISNFDLNATYTFTPSSGVTVSSTGIVTALSGTYTSTASINGCTSATSVSITIDSQPITPAAPTGASTQTLEVGATLNSIVVTGINIQWYASTSSSNPLPNNTLLENGTTYFASQNVNGCEGPRLAITVQTLLGINDFNTIKISFSPNPVTNFLDVKSNEILKSVSIMNALGQIVYFKNFNNTDLQLDLSDLSTGNYFVKAQSGEKQHVFKIIKK